MRRAADSLLESLVFLYNSHGFSLELVHFEMYLSARDKSSSFSRFLFFVSPFSSFSAEWKMDCEFQTEVPVQTLFSYPLQPHLLLVSSFAQVGLLMVSLSAIEKQSMEKHPTASTQWKRSLPVSCGCPEGKIEQGLQTNNVPSPSVVVLSTRETELCSRLRFFLLQIYSTHTSVQKLSCFYCGSIVDLCPRHDAIVVPQLTESWRMRICQSCKLLFCQVEGQGTAAAFAIAEQGRTTNEQNCYKTEDVAVRTVKFCVEFCQDLRGYFHFWLEMHLDRVNLETFLTRQTTMGDPMLMDTQTKTKTTTQCHCDQSILHILSKLASFKIVSLLDRALAPPLWPGLQDRSLVFCWWNCRDLVLHCFLQSSHISKSDAPDVFFDTCKQPKVTRWEVRWIRGVRNSGPAQDPEKSESVSSVVGGSVIHIHLVPIDHCPGTPPGVSSIKSAQNSLKDSLVYSQRTLNVLEIHHAMSIKKVTTITLAPYWFFRCFWGLGSSPLIHSFDCTFSRGS